MKPTIVALISLAMICGGFYLHGASLENVIGAYLVIAGMGGLFSAFMSLMPN